MNWPEVPLDQLGSVSRGKSRHRPRDAAHLYGGPYPFVQTGDVKHAGLYLSDFEQTYSEAGLAQSKLWPEGTLCITIAANIADTSILKIEACFPDSVIGFIPDPEKADARFIKYLFDARFKRQYQTFTQGAAQDNLSQGKLLSLKFPAPDVAEQRHIASILATYDALIENNRRRIALLEEAARQLYREWFVRFRFPGHEHVKVIDGVPEGWHKKLLSEMADVVRGRSYTSAELRDEGGRAFVNLKCIKRFGGFRDSGIKGIEGDFKEKHTVMPGDIVMAVTDMTRDAMIVAQSGRISKTVEAGAVFSMDLVKIVAKPEIQRDWLYSLLRFSRFAFDVREHATGTNVLHLKPKHIEDWKGLLPPHNVRKWFVEVVGVIFDQIDNLQLQSQSAAKARDLLLPKLMSGAITV